MIVRFSTALTSAEKLYESGQLQECRGALEVLIKLCPKDAQSRQLLGKTLWSLGEKEAALLEMERSLEINPYQADLLKYVVSCISGLDPSFVRWSFLKFLHALIIMNNVKVCSVYDLLVKKISSDIVDLNNVMEQNNEKFITDMKSLHDNLKELRYNLENIAVSRKKTVIMRFCRLACETLYYTPPLYSHYYNPNDYQVYTDTQWQSLWLHGNSHTGLIGCSSQVNPVTYGSYPYPNQHSSLINQYVDSEKIKCVGLPGHLINPNRKSETTKNIKLKNTIKGKIQFKRDKSTMITISYSFRVKRILKLGNRNLYNFLDNVFIFHAGEAFEKFFKWRSKSKSNNRNISQQQVQNLTHFPQSPASFDYLKRSEFDRIFAVVNKGNCNQLICGFPEPKTDGNQKGNLNTHLKNFITNSDSKDAAFKTAKMCFGNTSEDEKCLLMASVEDAIDNFRFDDSNLKYLPQIFNNIAKEANVCDYRDDILQQKCSNVQSDTASDSSYVNVAVCSDMCNDSNNLDSINVNHTDDPLSLSKTDDTTVNQRTEVLLAIEMFGSDNHLILQRLNDKPSLFDIFNQNYNNTELRSSEDNSKVTPLRVSATSGYTNRFSRPLKSFNLFDVYSKDSGLSISKENMNRSLLQCVNDYNIKNERELHEFVSNDYFEIAVPSNRASFYLSYSIDPQYKIPNISVIDLPYRFVDSVTKNLQFSKRAKGLLRLLSSDILDMIKNTKLFTFNQNYSEIACGTILNYDQSSERHMGDDDPRSDVSHNCHELMLPNQFDKNIFSTNYAIYDEVARFAYRSVIISSQMDSLVYFNLPHLNVMPIYKTSEFYLDLNLNCHSLYLMRKNIGCVLTNRVCKFIESQNGCVLICCNNPVSCELL